MRRRPTRSEHRLWRGFLRHVAPQWYRQRPLACGLIPDFYCPGLRLVIEVDGGVHDHPVQQARDAARTRLLQAHNLRVLRVRADAVEQRLEGTCAALWHCLDARADALGTAHPMWRPRHPRARPANLP